MHFFRQESITISKAIENSQHYSLFVKYAKTRTGRPPKNRVTDPEFKPEDVSDIRKALNALAPNLKSTKELIIAEEVLFGSFAGSDIPPEESQQIETEFEDEALSGIIGGRLESR